MREEGKTHAGVQSDLIILILIYVSKMGRRDRNIPRSASFPPRHVYHGVSVLSSGASMPLATVRLISLQAHPGALCVGEDRQQWETRWGPTAVPVLAHNPRALLSWDSAEACAPACPLVPFSIRRLKLLSRGSPLYIFRYKFGRGSCTPRLSIGSPSCALYGPAWHHPRRLPLISRVYC